MATHCTCGTELAPDSLFCHKCGKPQREIAEYVPEPAPVEEPVPAAPVQAAPAPVNFHNRLAIQIGLIMAILAILTSFLVYFNWLAAGFFTVLIYRRRTGQPLNLQTGVRLGWITGILIFVLMTVLLTFLVAFLASGALTNMPAEMRNTLDPRVLEAMKSLQSGPIVAQTVVMLFIFSTLLSMAGGALGAKFSSRSR
jgi:hypothetical protein